MAHSLNAKKANRQNETHRLKNRALKSEIKTWTKKLEQAAKDKDRALAEQYFRTTTSKLDKLLKKGIYKKNTIARKKSHCAKLVHQIG